MRAILRERWRRGIALGAIFILAILLRLWGLIAGSPVWHPDEIFMVAFPLNFFSGDLNPHRFYYPTLHFYTLGAVYGFCFLWQKLMGGGWTAVEFVAYHYFWNPEHLRLAARLVGVAFSVGTIVWAAVLSARIYGRNAALWAALLLGVCVVYVRQSPLAGVDAPAAFWYTGAIWGAVRLIDRHRLRDYLLAGLLVGLAGGTKYPAAAAGIAVAVAHLLCRRHVFDRRLWLSGLLAVGVFFAVSPYILLDFKTFIGHFLFQVVHAEQGRVEGGEWWYHLLFTLRHGLGWPGLLLFVLGLSRTIWHPRKETWIVVAGFIGCYAAISWGQLTFTRYALPLLPLQAVLAAGAIQLLRKIEWRILLTVLAALGPLYGSVRVARLLGEPDTRTEAREWIETNVRAGALILLEPHGPQLRSSALLREYEEQRRFRSIREALLSVGGRPVFQLALLPTYSVEMERSERYYHKELYSWFDLYVISSHIKDRYRSERDKYPVQNDFYDDLERNCRQIRTFSPGAGMGPIIEVFRRTGNPPEEPRFTLDRAGARSEPFLAFMRGVAAAYEETGNEAPAMALYRALLELQPNDPKTLAQVGTLVGGREGPEAGLRLLRRSVELDPIEPTARMNLGVLLCQAGRFTEGIPILERLVEEDPGNAELHGNLGSAFLSAGRADRAAFHFRRFLELAPDHASAPEIGRLLQQLGG